MNRYTNRRSLLTSSRTNSSNHNNTSGNERVRFKSDFQKQCLLRAAEQRGWVQTTDESEWNVYWASIGKVRKIFNLENGLRLRDDQIINHFPNHYELTRKDLMVKNIKRYRKSIEKMGYNPYVAQSLHFHGVFNNLQTFLHGTNSNSIVGTSGGSSNSKQSSQNIVQMQHILNCLDFVPSTYNLPADYPLFEEEFRRMHTKSRKTKWILKPSNKAQGSGIVIINKLSQIKKWVYTATSNAKQAKEDSGSSNLSTSYVISRYIDRPLLVGGRKFDLRLYALITCYRPLKIYYYKQGFARFSNVKYTTERDQMNNAEIHLTNVAIQKHGNDYNPNHGNKWSMKNFECYIESLFGYLNLKLLQKRILDIIIHSALAVQSVMLNDKHCFECYGYDIIIDETLKPWLIEINASPSLSATTKADRVLKRHLILDLFNVTVPNDFPSTKTTSGGTNWNPSKSVGDFILIYDELAMSSNGSSGDNNGSSGNGGFTSNANISSASGLTSNILFDDRTFDDDSSFLLKFGANSNYSNDDLYGCNYSSYNNDDSASSASFIESNNDYSNFNGNYGYGSTTSRYGHGYNYNTYTKSSGKRLKNWR